MSQAEAAANLRDANSYDGTDKDAPIMVLGNQRLR
jgi:hypothetical protein